MLVVYNSRHADSAAIWDYYSARRPGVLGCDLNDPALVPGNISYQEFVSRIRSPLRNHLSATGLEEQVVVLVLTRGIPHRILDLQAGTIGDQPNNAYARIQSGQATYASVDSELTLLWQNLESGDAGGSMDSPADNNILNPYFNVSDPITGFSRSKITGTKKFQSISGPRWRMLERNNGPASTPGDLYLTARLDGNSLASVLAMIDRAQSPCYDAAVDHLIQDKSSSNGTIDSGDYNIANMLVAGSWESFVYEQTNTFLIGMNGDLRYGNTGTQRFGGSVAALTGYGGNHSGGNKSGFMKTFSGQFTNGAVYNSYESYSARKFGGVGGFSDHGQLSDWLDAGGTLGVGTAWEPLASGAAKNYAVLKNYFLSGRTWVEAAWSGAQYLSWQTVVIGDPLTTAAFRCPPTVALSKNGTLCESSGSVVTCTATISEPMPKDVVVKLSFQGADYPGDFTASVGPDKTITIPANQTSASFALTAVNDSLAEGDEVVVISLESGDGYLPSGSGIVVPIEDSALGRWQTSHFGEAANDPIAAPQADPDTDGYPNVVEYALGLDPQSPSVLPTGAGLFLEHGGDGTAEAVYRFPVDTAKPDVLLRPESSEDLVTWSPAASTPAGIAGTIEWHEVRRTVASSDRRFFRLRVELAP